MPAHIVKRLIMHRGGVATWSGEDDATGTFRVWSHTRDWERGDEPDLIAREHPYSSMMAEELICAAQDPDGE